MAQHVTHTSDLRTHGPLRRMVGLPQRGLSIISGAFLLLFYALEVPHMSTPDAPQTFGTL